MSDYIKYTLLIAYLYLSCSFYTPSVLYDVKTYGQAIVDRVVLVSSGDHFKADLQNHPDIIGKNITIYIFGVSTPPERSTNKKIKKKAILAKEFTKKRLCNANLIELKNMQRGSPYFSIIAEVYIDGKNIARELIRARLGKRYYGGPKPSWP